MSKQYAVIGLGKFGFSVATTLAQAGKEVLAVDKDAEPVQEIADLVTYAARADITDSRVFASLGISNMDVVIATELGMVYSKPGQTVYYPQNSDDYVIQYKNVPDRKSVV